MKLSERLEALVARLDETTDGEYLERLSNGHAIALQCMEFIRDHGPALAELARSVEDSDIAKGSMDYMPDNYRMLIIHMANGAVANPYRGQFFRLVPYRRPTPPDPGHE